MTTTFKAYLIQCITNLHVGSGDANYGIIDKLVQRDPVTNYPTIHASSLKGALREHFENHEVLKSNVNEIFGKEGEDNEMGSYKFLNADLIALPLRSNYQQYILSFDEVIRQNANQKSKLIFNKEVFNIFENVNKAYGVSCDYDVYVEDIKLVEDELTNIFKDFIFPINMEKFANVKTEDFKVLAKNLPVIARNKVGENKNLWYEEIVPHQTIFITIIGSNQSNDEFDKALTNDLIQIGGNASVGYGLCKFYELKAE
jgi:CRISPR-associated protein Cmr4